MPIPQQEAAVASGDIVGSGSTILAEIGEVASGPFKACRERNAIAN